MLKWIPLLLLSCACPCAAAQSQLYTVNNAFTVSLPAGWAREAEPYGLSDREKGVYGADFLSPGGAEFPARISVDYYAPGNLENGTYEKYIRRHSKPPLGAGLDGKVYGPVKNGRAGNYYAKVFDRKTFQFVPPRSLKAKKVFFYEKFYVVTVRQGFYVLRLTAPLTTAKAAAKTFDAFAASFIPLAR